MKLRVSAGWIAGSLFVLVALCVAPTAASWQITTLDSTGNVGSRCRMALDAAGNPHVIYVDADANAFKTISLQAGVWQSPVVVDTVESAGSCDINLDAFNLSRFSYRNNTTGSLRFAGQESGVPWLYAAIDSTGDDVGRSCSIAATIDGGLAAAAANNTAGTLVTYTADPSFSWSGPETVDAATGSISATDLTERLPGKLAFVHRDNLAQDVLFSDEILQSPSWAFTNVSMGETDDVGRSCSIAATIDGGLTAAAANNTAGTLVTYTADPSFAWSGPLTVDAAPGAVSHTDVIDRPAGGVAYSYRNLTQTSLRFADALFAAPAWQRSLIASTDNVGRHVAIARTALEEIVVSFHQFHPSGFGKIGVAQKQPDQTWHYSTVVSALGSSPGDLAFTDLDVRQDTWFVVYRDPNLKDLHMASGDSIMLFPQQTTDIGSIPPLQPSTRLSNRPNPFNANTTISFALDSPQEVTLEIYDVQGRRIRELLSRTRLLAQFHEVLWDGRNDREVTVPSGVYFVRLRVQGGIQTHSVIAIK